MFFRYLKCLKVGCKARGQIADKKYSPIVLSNDLHNHRPLTLEEQADKRSKASGKNFVLPPTKRLHCYIKKKDGTFVMVAWDHVKFPNDSWARYTCVRYIITSFSNDYIS